MQTAQMQKDRPDGLTACLSMVGGTEYTPEKTLWNDEMNRQERRIFLIAARLPMTWDNRAWQELTDMGRVEVRKSMLRFKKRFFPLLSGLGEVAA